MTTFKTILQDLINGAEKVNREQFLTDYHYKFFNEALNEIKKIENNIGYDYEFNYLIPEQLEQYEDQVSDIQHIIDELRDALIEISNKLY